MPYLCFFLVCTRTAVWLMVVDGEVHTILGSEVNLLGLGRRVTVRHRRFGSVIWGLGLRG